MWQVLSGNFHSSRDVHSTLESGSDRKAHLNQATRKFQTPSSDKGGVIESQHPDKKGAVVQEGIDSLLRKKFSHELTLNSFLSGPNKLMPCSFGVALL